MIWDSNLIAKLLELYKENRVLWDPKHHNYADKYSKQMALQGITEELGVPVSPSHVDRKYRTMRAAYQVEVRNINAAKLRGFFYKPTLHWFDTFDKFMQETKTIKGRDIPVEIMAESPNTVQLEGDANKRNKCKKLIYTKGYRNRVSVRWISDDESNEPNNTNEMMEETSDESDDEFQTFADHIAQQLRSMSVHRAVMIQNQIQRVFANDKKMHGEEEEYITS